MKLNITDIKELESGGAECIVEMDTKTKEYLINYAILDILQKQLDYVDKLHKEEYKNES